MPLRHTRKGHIRLPGRRAGGEDACESEPPGAECRHRDRQVSTLSSFGSLERPWGPSTGLRRAWLVNHTPITKRESPAVTH